MALFYPADRRVACTDGTAAASLGSPGTLNDLSQWWRSGGDISVANKDRMRGVANRPADEFIYLRRTTPSISDLTLEQDETDPGPNSTFDMADAQTGHLRAYRVQYRTGATRIIAALLINVADSFQDEDALLMTVSLRGTGGMVEAGF